MVRKSDKHFHGFQVINLLPKKLVSENFRHISPIFLKSILYGKHYRTENPFFVVIVNYWNWCIFFFQIHFTRADCVGNETNLFSCKMQLHKDQCTHGEDAGVRCNAPLVKKLQVRILCFFSFISYCYIFWSIFIFFYLTIVL